MEEKQNPASIDQLNTLSKSSECLLNRVQHSRHTTRFGSYTDPNLK